MHHLCAVAFVLSSHAQGVSVEPLYLDDRVGKIIEPSALSAQSLGTEPRVEEPSGASEDMTVATEAVQPGDEIQVAERSPPVQLEIQTSEQSTDSIPTHVAIIPSATAVPIGATESASKEPSKEELARIIESILEEGMQFGDVSQIAKHTIQSESEQTNEPAEARRRPVDGTAERNAPELVNPEPITANSDAATGMSVASINGAEKTWSGENLATGAGRLTEIVEQSSPAQTVPNEQTGLSKQGEGEFLNTFSQDLE